MAIRHKPRFSQIHAWPIVDLDAEISVGRSYGISPIIST
jgi:hypothetical protein